MNRQLIKIVSVIVVTLISCDKKEEPNQKDDTPKILVDNSIKGGRYSKRSSDLTNLLYQDLVDKSADLQSLENKINEFNPQDTLDEFIDFNIKSEDYYRSANHLSDQIHDSVTKNKIIELIEKSKTNYIGKTKEINQLLSTIKDKNNSINDYHNVLKIVLTLPIIEKYQTENLPDSKKYKRIIKKQDSIIEKTKKLTPNY